MEFEAGQQRLHAAGAIQKGVNDLAATIANIL